MQREREIERDRDILDYKLPYVNSVLSFLARGHRPLGAKVRNRKRERES